MLIPDVEKSWLEIVDGLDTALSRDSERARDKLRGILGGRIEVTPDDSKQFLWANYELGFSALVPSAEIMIAGGASRFIANTSYIFRQLGPASKRLGDLDRMRAEHTGQAAASVAAALACLSGRRADPSLAGSRCHSSRGCYVRPPRRPREQATPSELAR